MNELLLSDLISSARLQKYSINFEESFNLHLLNTELCESFYSSLSYLEIILRNQIDLVLSNTEEGENWIYNYIDNNDLKDKDKNKLISELNFGFWTAFFMKKNRDIVHDDLLKKIFPFCHHNMNINVIAHDLNAIRNYRNKIFHYGNILIKRLHILTPEKMHNKIYKYIRYISGNEIITHLNKIDRFNTVLHKIRKNNIEVSTITDNPA